MKLTRLLEADGHQVLSIVRDPDHVEELRGIGAEVDVLDLEQISAEDLGAAVAGCDAVVFAAGAGPGSGPERKETVDYGAAVKLIAAAERSDVRRYVMVSSRGANAHAEGDDFGVYLRAKGRADDALRLSGLDATIVRPVALTDDPGTGAVEISEYAEGETVSREDVAAVIAAVLTGDAASGVTFELASGHTPIPEALVKL